MDKSIRIRQEGERVLFISNGVLIADLPWTAARDLSHALHSVAKLAEEHANHDQISTDAAMMARAGIPFGLTNNKAIQEEARMKALHDSYLRKNIPMSAGSQGVLGAPSVRGGK